MLQKKFYFFKTEDSQMDIKKEHNLARLKFQSRLNEITEPWEEIPSNEIPEPLKDFAKYLLVITTFLAEDIDTSDQRKNISFKKSDDIWLFTLLTNWIETNPVISDQDKKEYSGTVGAIRLAMQFFAVNVILDVNNTGLSIDELSAKLKGSGTIMAEQSKMERRLRDIENELGGDDLLAPRTIKYFKVGDSVPEQPELGTVKNIEFDESINSYIVEFENGSPRKSVSGSSFGVMSHFTASASHYYITSYSEDVSNQKT